MTDHVELYARRIAELEQLVDAHVESGSLDEGNGSIFDGIIDAWLEDELMRVEQLHADDALTRITAAERLAQRRAATRERRVRRQERRSARRRARADEVSAFRDEVDTALGDVSSTRRSRRQERAEASRRRLDAAREQLEVSRAQLTGAAVAIVADGPLAVAQSAPTQHDDASTDDRTAEKVA